MTALQASVSSSGDLRRMSADSAQLEATTNRFPAIIRLNCLTTARRFLKNMAPLPGSASLQL